jgi:hypothetical protein
MVKKAKIVFREKCKRSKKVDFSGFGVTLGSHWAGVDTPVPCYEASLERLRCKKTKRCML